MNITEMPVWLVLAAIMAGLAGLCCLAVVAIDVSIDRAERPGTRHATGRRAARRGFLLLAGVFLAIAFYHLVVQR